MGTYSSLNYPSTRSLRTRSRLMLAAFTVVALMSACASTRPTATQPTAATATDCQQLNAEIAQTEQAKRAAQEKEKGAWKAVLPFAVAARYASGKSAATQADQQLERLDAELARQGCTRG